MHSSLSRAAISAGDEQRSVEAAAEVEQWLAIVEDPWLHVRAATRCSASSPASSIGSTTPSSTSVVPPRPSQLLGFLQTEAYQVSSLGRAQCQAGDYEAGAATLALAIDKAEATGDLRLAALARVHLGRVLRRARARATAHAPRSMPRARGTATPAAANRPRSGSVSSPQWTPTMASTRRATVASARSSSDARAQRRCPRRSLRPRRARAHRGGRRRLRGSAHPARSRRRPVRCRVALHHRTGPGRRALTDATVRGSRRSLRPQGRSRDPAPPPGCARRAR